MGGGGGGEGDMGVEDGNGRRKESRGIGREVKHIGFDRIVTAGSDPAVLPCNRRGPLGRLSRLRRPLHCGGRIFFAIFRDILTQANCQRERNPMGQIFPDMAGIEGAGFEEQMMN